MRTALAAPFEVLLRLVIVHYARDLYDWVGTAL
jgi:hypothetical protein